jgi:carbamoylphosphate synthase small subunit
VPEHSQGIDAGNYAEQRIVPTAHICARPAVVNSTKDSPCPGTENPSRSRRQRCLAEFLIKKKIKGRKEQVARQQPRVAVAWVDSGYKQSVIDMGAQHGIDVQVVTNYRY